MLKWIPTLQACKLFHTTTHRIAILVLQGKIRTRPSPIDNRVKLICVEDMVALFGTPDEALK